MQNHGVASYSSLREHWSRREIDAALAVGLITRVTRGWYALAGANPVVISALRAKGRVGCLTGCAIHGLWTPRSRETHVVYGSGIDIPPTPDLAQHFYEAPQPRSPVWPVHDCLAQVAQRHCTEEALVVLESALHLGVIDVRDVSGLLGAPTERHKRIAEHLDRAESGSETRVRFFLKSRRVQVRPQVLVPGVGRVDLLVGDRLIIECDGAEFHRSPDHVATDRARDLAARDLGLDTLRLSFQQIWVHWEATKQSLLRQVQSRQHRHRRSLQGR